MSSNDEATGVSDVPMTSADDNNDEAGDKDPVVKEIDVFLAKSLANNIYILQYPIRPQNKTYDDCKYVGARIKPKSHKLELEMHLDTHNANYSRTKGEQICLNVDGGISASSSSSSKSSASLSKQADQQQQQQPSKYFRSHLMDKIVYTSTNATLGQMNRLYHLGALTSDATQLHLTPVRSILQMKPSFEYFDIYEKKVKDLKDAAAAAAAKTSENEYSTEEESEMDKAELVTLKYSSPHHAASLAAQEQQEPTWTNVTMVNDETHEDSMAFKSKLMCVKRDNHIQLEYSQDEFIRRLVDAPSFSNAASSSSFIKQEKQELV